MIESHANTAQSVVKCFNPCKDTFATTETLFGERLWPFCRFVFLITRMVLLTRPQQIVPRLESDYADRNYRIRFVKIRLYPKTTIRIAINRIKSIGKSIQFYQKYEKHKAISVRDTTFWYDRCNLIPNTFLSSSVTGVRHQCEARPRHQQDRSAEQRNSTTREVQMRRSH